MRNMFIYFSYSFHPKSTGNLKQEKTKVIIQTDKEESFLNTLEKKLLNLRKILRQIYKDTFEMTTTNRKTKGIQAIMSEAPMSFVLNPRPSENKSTRFTYFSLSI